MQRIEFTGSERHTWAGMGDFLLVSPDGKHQVELIYDGEPPHGDSYHRATIDGSAYPGHIWGCMFGFSSCSRYLAFSAMPEKFERRTSVVDLLASRYFLLPDYIYQFDFSWPILSGEGTKYDGLSFIFDGRERWIQF